MRGILTTISPRLSAHLVESTPVNCRPQFLAHRRSRAIPSPLAPPTPDTQAGKVTKARIRKAPVLGDLPTLGRIMLWTGAFDRSLRIILVQLTLFQHYHPTSDGRPHRYRARTIRTTSESAFTTRLVLIVATLTSFGRNASYATKKFKRAMWVKKTMQTLPKQKRNSANGFYARDSQK